MLQAKPFAGSEMSSFGVTFGKGGGGHRCVRRSPGTTNHAARVWFTYFGCHVGEREAMAIVLPVTLQVFRRTTTLALCVVAPRIIVLVRTFICGSRCSHRRCGSWFGSAGRGRVRDSEGVYNLWLLEVAYGGPEPCSILLLVL